MNSDFIKRILRLLHDVERHATTPEQHEALRNSRIALHFILERGEAGESLSPVLAFPTKEEADAWLESHPAPPHGAFVGVGELRYHVAYARELKHRKLLPLPTQEEWARMEEEPEEEEVEEKSNHPPPRLGTEFHLFDLFNVVCFHLYELEQRVASPEELEALRTAKTSFDFVMRMGEDHGFEEYLETLRSSRTSPPARSFSSRKEAESWLAKQPEPPLPAVVSIGSELFSVGYNRRHQMRLLLRIPTPQELDAGSA